MYIPNPKFTCSNSQAIESHKKLRIFRDENIFTLFNNKIYTKTEQIHADLGVEYLRSFYMGSNYFDCNFIHMY